MFKDPLLALGNAGWVAKILPCTVATTAEAEGEDVYVTLDLEGPAVRLGPCTWRPRVNGSGDVKLPERGDEGIIIVAKENKPWLLY